MVQSPPTGLNSQKEDIGLSKASLEQALIFKQKHQLWREDGT